MATITRIEVANFLCDGYTEGREWIPLYRGETFRLFGRSAALQIDNGGGKTSLTESSLYLLSQDRRLKPKLAERIAPPENGWTHVRMEFVEKPHDEDILQRDLITIDPEDIPGVTYVIGLAWSRGKDPNFYYYQGLLSDAPCYHKEPNKLQLVGNDKFQKTVERMPGARWNKWRNQKEWLEDIRQFTNIEVVKKNVEFQLAGAGDYSAMINKVEQETGESYDAAFFRQFVAPELLRQVMGTEGEDDEVHFEDTLYKTLKPTADALVNINLRQHELDDAEAALAKFEPVEATAKEVLDANAAYEEELASVIRDAAVVHVLAVRDPVPGMPSLRSGASWIKDKKLTSVISDLVIDKRAGILITDQGLAKLMGTETKRINERAVSLRLTPVVCGSQVIDFMDDLKETGSQSDAVENPADGGYVTDNKGDLKESRRGQHRKYAISGYGLEAAKAFLPAGDPLNLGDLLTRAFGVAMESIDTNPYRQRQRELAAELLRAKSDFDTADKEFNEWSSKHEVLVSESRDAAENEVAYQTFAARIVQFLPEHKDAPLEAKAWATGKLSNDQKALSEHNNKVADLTGDFRTWTQVTAKYRDQALSDALTILIDRREEAISAGKTAQDAMRDACNLRDDLRPKFTKASGNLEKARKAHHRLSSLAEALPVFRRLFGDVDPLLLNPTDDLAKANKELMAVNGRLSQATKEKEELDNLKPMVKVFLEVFGDTDPSALNPTKELLAHMEKIAIEEAIMTDHQLCVEALEQFREIHPSLEPGQWLERAEQQRQNLLSERQNVRQRGRDIAGEIANLDTYAVADSRVYASALDVLAKESIAFERLHTIVMAEAGERRQAMLSLFSAALSAPVVSSPEEADRATQILERNKLTIPVFLLMPLRQFVQSGSYEVTGDVTHTFLAGRRTRQVDILLNPSLIAEEKERLGREAGDLENRDIEIGRELDAIDPSSDGVALALKARDALRRGSEQKYAEAQSRFSHLSNELPGLQHRVDAADSITAMKRYLTLGGEQAWQKLVSSTIPQAEAQVARIKTEIQHLEHLVTEEASRALIAARDFHRSGGDEALKQAEADVAHFEPEVRDLEDRLERLREKIEGELAAAQQSASILLAEIDETFGVDKRDLETAIAFEGAGSAKFMEAADAECETLQKNLGISIARLQGIDFDRAYQYVEASKADERALAERIAEALGKKNNAAARRSEADRRRNNFEGEIATLQPFVDDLHDTIVEIKAQYGKIAGFSDDIRARVATEGKTHPEILEYAEALRTGCLGKLPSTATGTKAAIANLRESVRQLEIETKTLAQRRQAKLSTQNAFKKERDHFCEQARDGRIKGLQLPEIERIADATTLAQLSTINQIREKIRATIDEYTAKLGTLRETMETNKAATIDNLVQFARQAEKNLEILDDVMKRTPDARFFVEADVAGEETIRKIIESLIIEIQDREQAARDRNPVVLNKDIERRNKSYKDEIHRQIYANIFAKERVYFTHAAIWDGAKSPLSGEGGGLSTGQRTALMMMWLIKQAEYSLTRAALMYGSRKQQKAALKSAQRIMFFDGLFSNLSNEDYIDHAFQGLKDVDENFQLIGLIHNPHYVNNKDIFPVHLVGKKRVATKGGKRRRFVTVELWQDDNGMITYTSAYRDNKSSGEARA